ncbi:hypothetical protein Tco_0262587 [Tanacetum coccineum]
MKTNMVKHDVEVESLGKCVDEIDKPIELIGEMQRKQEDRSCVHASNELHLHVFRVVVVDILQNTNFFRAFIASADVPSIYIQQFWNTLGKDTKTGVDNFQLDELWFNLNANLLRNALGITPKDSAHPFVPPPAGDLVIDFVNNLGYLEELQFVFKIVLPEIFENGCRKPCQLTIMTGEEVKKKKKAPKAGKPTYPAPAKQPKHAKKKTSKTTPLKKICKEKRSDHLVEEEDEEGQPASELQVEDDEYNLQRGIQMILESLQASIGGVATREPDPRFIQKLPDVEGKGKRRTPVTQDASTGPSTQPPDDTSANVVHDTSSLADSTNDVETNADMEQSNNETDTDILNIVAERGEEVSNMVALEEKTVEFDKGQAGSDPAVMSSSSTVTYTSVYTDSEPWRFQLVSDEEPEASQSPRQAPPSPDYVPGPEHPPSLDYVPGPEEPEHAPLSPDYVPEPEYPEYLVSSDADEPIEDKPLPADASPTTLSPGYVADSDLEEDPADYPADGRDKEEEGKESSEDDADVEDEEKASEDDDEEEEEH